LKSKTYAKPEVFWVGGLGLKLRPACEALGLSYEKVRQRLARGSDVAKAFENRLDKTAPSTSEDENRAKTESEAKAQALLDAQAQQLQLTLALAAVAAAAMEREHVIAMETCRIDSDLYFAEQRQIAYSVARAIADQPDATYEEKEDALDSLAKPFPAENMRLERMEAEIRFVGFVRGELMKNVPMLPTNGRAKEWAKYPHLHGVAEGLQAAYLKACEDLDNREIDFEVKIKKTDAYRKALWLALRRRSWSPAETFENRCKLEGGQGLKTRSLPATATATATTSLPPVNDTVNDTVNVEIQLQD
jgi:hypothetical protein